MPLADHCAANLQTASSCAPTPREGLYASSDELEEIFIKPLFAKLEEKLNSPLHPFSDYIHPTVPVTVKTMLQGQPWAQYPNPNCGHTDNG
ncbi:TPA: hypothetical protein ACSITI_003465 [Acinetobacter baumannii]